MLERKLEQSATSWQNIGEQQSAVDDSTKLWLEWWREILLNLGGNQSRRAAEKLLVAERATRDIDWAFFITRKGIYNPNPFQLATLKKCWISANGWASNNTPTLLVSIAGAFYVSSGDLVRKGHNPRAMWSWKAIKGSQILSTMIMEGHQAWSQILGLRWGTFKSPASMFSFPMEDSIIAAAIQTSSIMYLSAKFNQRMCCTLTVSTQISRLTCWLGRKGQKHRM